MWTLETSDAAGERLTFRLPPGAVKTVGRSTGAEFIVDAALVSRLHCQFTATADSLHVKDLGSTNGTFVNGKRVTNAELKDGDTLSVGRVDLIVSRSP
ncbi:MAG TPA: FHA domain-containing protein [Vicinamibacterales bacterium]|nr:FHA domain-containing protein [Vicinamibacterales bacterium]